MNKFYIGDGVQKTGPCKTCTERHVGCHGTCQAYISWSNELHEESRKIHLAKLQSHYKNHNYR